MDNSIKIDSSAKLPAPKKHRGLSVGLLVALGAICLMSVIAFCFKEFRVQVDPSPIAPVVNEALEAAATSDEASADESQLQWASPTKGPPITLEYVPWGTQAILHLRPAELMAHAEGEKILAALGRWGERTAHEIEQATGVKLTDIETLLVAFHRENDQWQFTLRATLVEPWSAAKLKQVQTGSLRADFLPRAGQGRVLVSCPREMLANLTEQGQNAAILARDLERLLMHTDAKRTATLLMPAKFLDTEGRELFVDDGQELISAFDAIVPDNASAIELSIDWHGHFFCELSATIVQNAPAHRFAAKFAEQLKSAEQQLAASLESKLPHAYGQAIEKRLPAMLKAMSDYTRVSHQDGIAIARCYLPIQAGHNLLLASRLRLSDNAVASKAQPTLSFSEKLNQPTSLTFPKETLEKALEMLATDLGIPIQIASRDLQLEGITKNQMLSLDLRDRPASEVLVEVLRRANPDREAAGPSDPRQTLVYVIRDDAVIVTTRKAATERGEVLPEVFRASDP